MKARLLVVTELYPNNTNSFLGSFVYQQLHLLKKQYDITVITTHYIPVLKRLKIIQQRQYTDNGIRVYNLPYYPWWISLLGIFKLASPQTLAYINKRYIGKKILRLALKIHRQNPYHIVHGHEAYIGDEVGPIGLALGIPAIFTLHGLYHYHLQGFGVRTMRAIMQNLQRIENFIAVSSIAAQSYRENGISEKSFEIIPNGIILPHQGAICKRDDILAFAKGRFVLLTAGFLVPEKRIDLAIQTMARLKNKNSVLVIAGSGFTERKLKKMVVEEHCEERVLFLGAIPPVKMNSVYASADIFLHPSVIDSFSMVCLEAMSNSLPVICTNKIGILEFVTIGKDILVIEPDSVTALIEATDTLVSNANLRTQIGQSARRAAEKLNWEKQVQHISTTYEHLLSQ